MTRCCTHNCTQGRDCPRRMWARTPSHDGSDSRMTVAHLAVFCALGLASWVGIAALLIGSVQ